MTPSSLYVIVESAIPSRWLNAVMGSALLSAAFHSGRGSLTNVHPPFLPLDFITVNLEADALRLDNVKGLQIIPNLEILITFGDEVWEEIKSPGGRRDALPVGVI